MNVNRIVIVGGGFGGVTVAQRTERLFDKSIEIVVISKDNHLVFTPMLPEVAGRALSPFHVAVAGRVATKRTVWIEAAVDGVDAEANKISYSLADGRTATMDYGHLVFACGSETNLNSMPGLAAHTIACKTVGEAIMLGNQLIARFEQAASEPDDEIRKKLLHVVVLGGGFSGVEVAGHMNDLIADLHPSYPQLQHIKPQLTIVQRGEKVLPELSHASLSDFTYRKLKESGIQVRLKTAVKEVTANGVIVEPGGLIPSDLIVCTIGTAPTALISKSGFPLTKGRIQTQPDMRVTGSANVWALGDCSVTMNAFDNQPTPPTAQFALREAKQLADNLKRVEHGETTKPFRFRPQGLLASIGRKNGVAEIYGVRFSGRLAWFLWRGVYLMKIPTLQTKIGVAIDWAVGIFFNPPIARLRLPGSTKMNRQHFATGDTLLQVGQTSTTVSLIENGQVSVNADRTKEVLATLEKGDYFGLARQSSEEVREVGSFTLKAETPVDVLSMDRNAFANLSESLAPLQSHMERGVKSRQILVRMLEESMDGRPWTKTAVSQVMMQTGDLWTTETTLKEAVRNFESNQEGYWVVDEQQKLAGYFGRMELYSAMSEQTGIEVSLKDHLRASPEPLSADQDVFSATVQLFRHEYETLPVVDDAGQVIGFYEPLLLVRRLVHEDVAQEQV